MARRTIPSLVLLAAVAGSGCSTWRQGRVAAAPEGVYATVLRGGPSAAVEIDLVEPEPLPFRLGAGDALGRAMYTTWLASIRADEPDGDTRTVTAPDPFAEIVGQP